MSTQDERLRSLNQARDLLDAACLEPTLPPGTRAAARLARHGYPTDSDMDRLLDVEDAAQVQAWGWSLALTRAVVEEIVRDLPIKHIMHRWALTVERHFPEMSYLPAQEGDTGWTAVFLDPMSRLLGKK